MALEVQVNKSELIKLGEDIRQLNLVSVKEDNNVQKSNNQRFGSIVYECTDELITKFHYADVKASVLRHSKVLENLLGQKTGGFYKIDPNYIGMEYVPFDKIHIAEGSAWSFDKALGSFCNEYGIPIVSNCYGDYPMLPIPSIPMFIEWLIHNSLRK